MYHGARHKHISHLELGEKCKSYSSGRDSFKHVAGNAMQSSAYREYCHPRGRPSHSLPARRSSYKEQEKVRNLIRLNTENCTVGQLNYRI